jgi:hypothetical protein
MNIIKVSIKKINKGVVKLTKNEVLVQLSNKEISQKEAYKLLYSEPKVRKPRRAHFLKVKVRVPDEGPANFFLGLILFFPIPMFIVRMVMRRFVKEEVTEQFQMSKSELIRLVSIAGVKIKINTHTNEKIYVRTF